MLAEGALVHQRDRHAMSEGTLVANSSMRTTQSASAFFYKAGTIEKLYGKQWMRKYAVLEGPYMHIFKKAPAAQSAAGANMRGRVSNNQLTATPSSGTLAPAEQTISLKFVAHLAVAIRKDGGRSFFFVSNFDGTSHCFAADSVAELGPWVESITKALEYYNPAATVAAVPAVAATQADTAQKAPPQQMVVNSKVVAEESVSSSSSSASSDSSSSSSSKKKEKNAKKDKKKSSRKPGKRHAKSKGSNKIVPDDCDKGTA